ncbi:hypothetical protein ALC62_13896 [Cyphomyrmex costatus]|uniref:Uncharacterized protein n=1 Tax=Cyphomyrmex costatus TaxID=456900 RepID=A0A195C5L9_9HYME|nr:hypothetical protein ALC62_13896 [Cyphomyrmex costatus]
MRSEKVRKGSVVLFGSCVAEAPTGRCYGRNVLFGPSRPTPWPVPPGGSSRGSRAFLLSCRVRRFVVSNRIAAGRFGIECM